jgi:hypothetical protein
MIVMLLGVLSLLGCAGEPATSVPDPERPGSTATPLGAESIEPLLAALVADWTDPTAWAAHIDSTDDGFARRAEFLRGNFAQFELTMTPAGRTAPLSPARQEVLGSTAVVHAVRIDWAAPGQAPATHEIWFTVTRAEGRLRWAGTSDGPSSAPGPVPLWLRHPVDVEAGNGSTVIATRGVDPAPWLTALETARQHLVAHDLDPGPITVQLPGDPADFNAVLGIREGSHHAVAASTMPFGATAHIVINPRVGGSLAEKPRQVLLTHEAVHVVTGPLPASVPLWFSEGYADFVALADHPDVLAAHEKHLADDQRRHGVGTTLVSDRELSPDHPRIDAHYQRAWLTVRVLDRGDGTADRVHAAVRGGKSLEDALAVAGWSEQSLTVAVQDELARLVDEIP